MFCNKPKNRRIYVLLKLDILNSVKLGVPECACSTIDKLHLNIDDSRKLNCKHKIYFGDDDDDDRDDHINTCSYEHLIFMDWPVALNVPTFCQLVYFIQ